MTNKHKDIPYHLMFEKEGYGGYAGEEHRRSTGPARYP